MSPESPNARGSAADMTRLTSMRASSCSLTGIRSGSSQFVTHVVYAQTSHTIARSSAVWSAFPTVGCGSR